MHRCNQAQDLKTCMECNIDIENHEIYTNKLFIKISSLFVFKISVKILLRDKKHTGNRTIYIIFHRDPMHGTPL